MNGRTNSNGTTTDTIQIPLDPVTNLDAVAGNAQVTLTWTDPLNKYATPEGEQAGDPDQLVSVWQYTAIVRKEGSAPTGIHDGILVAESQVHNQYQTNGYVDSGLTNDTLYYYGLFAVNEDGIESEVTAISAMPKAGTPVRDLAVGSPLYVNVNGAPVEYLIVHQGNPDSSIYDASCDGTWVWNKVAYDGDGIIYGQPKSYAVSTLHSHLTGDYLNRFDASTLSVVKTVKIPYVQYGNSGYNGHLVSGSSGVECQFFILSFRELGIPDSIHHFNNGSKLSYFTLGVRDTDNEKRQCYYRIMDSEATTKYLCRESTMEYLSDSEYTDGINFDGSPDSVDTTRNAIFIPAFILSRDARVDQYFNLVTE